MAGGSGAVVARSPGSSPTRVALALGSGGARGYAHIGVIEALHGAGLRHRRDRRLIDGRDGRRSARSRTPRRVRRLGEVADAAHHSAAAGPVHQRGRGAAGREDPGRGARHPRPGHHRATAHPLHRGGYRSVGRQVGVVSARPARRGDPGLHRDSGRDRPARNRRTPARRRRHPGPTADGPDRGGQRRPDHRGEPQRQRGDRQPRRGAGRHRRVVEPHGAQHLCAARHHRRPVTARPADRASRAEPIRRTGDRIGRRV